jgi:hypothetical protein
VELKEVEFSISLSDITGEEIVTLKRPEVLKALRKDTCNKQGLEKPFERLKIPSRLVLFKEFELEFVTEDFTYTKCLAVRWNLTIYDLWRKIRSSLKESPVSSFSVYTESGTELELDYFFH